MFSTSQIWFSFYSFEPVCVELKNIWFEDCFSCQSVWGVAAVKWTEERFKTSWKFEKNYLEVLKTSIGQIAFKGMHNIHYFLMKYFQINFKLMFFEEKNKVVLKKTAMVTDLNCNTWKAHVWYDRSDITLERRKGVDWSNFSLSSFYFHFSIFPSLSLSFYLFLSLSSFLSLFFFLCFSLSNELFSLFRLFFSLILSLFFSYISFSLFLSLSLSFSFFQMLSTLFYS